jgi:hypothetical protein
MGEDIAEPHACGQRQQKEAQLSKSQLNYLNFKQILVLEIHFLNRNLLFLQILQKIEVLIKYGS